MMAEQRMSWMRRSSDAPAAHPILSSGLNAHQQATPNSGQPAQAQMTDVDGPNSLLHAILQNSHLERFGTIVLTYLRVDNDTFQSICQLRNESLFARELHPLHPSIFVSPPQNLWDLIFQLRCHYQWQNFRLYAIQTLKKVVIDELHSRQDTRPLHTSTTASSAARSSTDEDIKPITNPRLSPNTKTLGATTREQRTAPSGQCWRCPSKGCPRTFQKRGHLSKHIERHHPDFLKLHHGWTPNQSLEPASTDQNSARENSSQVMTSPGNRTSTASTIKIPKLTVRDSGRRAASMSVSSSASISSISGTQSAISSDIPFISESNPGEWTGEFIPPYGSGYEAGGVTFADFSQDVYYTGQGQSHQPMDMELSYSERLSLDHRSQHGPTSSPRPN